MTNANVEIANDFFHDAEDLLHRYRLTVEHFTAIKSKRMKLFLDLRMGAECILKAYAAYFLMEGTLRAEVIHRVEGYKHNIPRMADDVKSKDGLINSTQTMADSRRLQFLAFSAQCAQLSNDF